MFSFFKKTSPKQPDVQEMQLNWLHADMHCHILPGIDDGAKDMETSLQMLRIYKEQGVNQIIATSHIKQNMFPNTRHSIEQAYHALLAAIEKEAMDINILYSAEYYLDENFLQLLNDNALMPFPGNYVLVEVSMARKPAIKLRDVAAMIQDRGYIPILAHPERYLYWSKNYSIFDELKASGWLLQVNLLSVAGYYGNGEKRTGRKLLDDDLADFMGTDAHKPEHLHFIADSFNDKWMQQLEYKYLMNKFLKL